MTGGMPLAEQIRTTTRLTPDDADRVANALEGAPAFVVSSFWALVKSGAYSTDEMIERLGALWSMAK